MTDRSRPFQSNRLVRLPVQSGKPVPRITRSFASILPSPFTSTMRMSPGLRPNDLARTESWSCQRSEEHTSELQSRLHLVCRLLLEKKKNNAQPIHHTPRSLQ